MNTQSAIFPNTPDRMTKEATPGQVIRGLIGMGKSTPVRNFFVRRGGRLLSGVKRYAGNMRRAPLALSRNHRNALNSMKQVSIQAAKANPNDPAAQAAAAQATNMVKNLARQRTASIGALRNTGILAGGYGGIAGGSALHGAYGAAQDRKQIEPAMWDTLASGSRLGMLFNPQQESYRLAQQMRSMAPERRGFNPLNPFSASGAIRTGLLNRGINEKADMIQGYGSQMPLMARLGYAFNPTGTVEAARSAYYNG